MVIAVKPSKTTPMLQVKSAHRTLTDVCCEAIRDAIVNGTFLPGGQLPPEPELVHMLGVSRTTLREALRTLEEQGFIERRRGVGTYVREASIVKDLSINFGLTEMITQAGMNPGTKDSSVRIERASSAAAEALKLTEGEAVVGFDRVRTANQRPVVRSLDIIPTAILGEHDAQELLRAESVYRYLDEILRVRVVRGVAQLYPCPATPDIARKLDIRSGAPLLRITQVDYDALDRPVVYSIEHHLSDAFVFVVNRKGPAW